MHDNAFLSVCYVLKGFFQPTGDHCLNWRQWYTLSYCLHFNSLFNVLWTINVDLCRCILKDAWEKTFYHKRLVTSFWDVTCFWAKTRHFNFYQILILLLLCMWVGLVMIFSDRFTHRHRSRGSFISCNLTSHVKTLLSFSILYLQHQ